MRGQRYICKDLNTRSGWDLALIRASKCEVSCSGETVGILLHCAGSYFTSRFICAMEMHGAIYYTMHLFEPVLSLTSLVTFCVRWLMYDSHDHLVPGIHLYEYIVTANDLVNHVSIQTKSLSLLTSL